jgi:proteic killer suppression protein
MILGFRDRWLEDFFLLDLASRKIPSELDKRLFRKLPPSNHFEKLRGKLAGLHSIRVNNQWRLIFHWNGSRGEATEVYLDNHSYR